MSWQGKSGFKLLLKSDKISIILIDNNPYYKAYMIIASEVNVAILNEIPHHLTCHKLSCCGLFSA